MGSGYGIWLTGTEYKSEISNGCYSACQNISNPSGGIGMFDAIEIAREDIPFTLPVALPLRYEAH